MNGKLDASAAYKQWGAAGGDTGTESSFKGLLSSFGANGTGDEAGDTLLAKTASQFRFWEKKNQTPDLESQVEGTGVEASSAGNFFSRFSAQPDDSGVFPTLPWSVRFKWFVILSLLAAGFFFLGVTFLPMIVFRPGKFALSFTFGSLLLQGAFAMLKGPNAYVKGLTKRDNIAFSGMYVGSLFLTLYACMVSGSYLMVLLASFFQAVSLGWYGASAIPGGKAGFKAFTAMFFRTAKAIVRKLGSMLAS